MPSNPNPRKTATNGEDSISAMELAMLQELPAITSGIELEMLNLPHVGQALRATRVAATFKECLAAKKAAELIDKLPAKREAVHLLVSGRFALADCVGAVLELARPATIKALHISTLGFSKRNIITFCHLLDSRQLGTLRLVCSHYFSGTDRAVYQFGAAELTKRAPRAGFLSLRTHAKVLALQLTDGRTVTIESSANLRSARNIENATLFGDDATYKFHRRWIQGLFNLKKGGRYAAIQQGKDRHA